ncbi:hypothetical protein DYD83_22270 [Dickeya fangzhongdai]|uniref:Uncharacterized protein n=1 Tax=Dickeya fangzhongdai TaxID=1778540 RepID=A0A2K8QTI0_9GAMM|nr:hypothetical protein CVE23_22185 [Dickeya fangzhongdai]QOH50223.1 hypothetical protein DYD82_22270 [Dickeya fangzhongdai]QOH54529.1 hypothetical protein DYD83_22270 [Dickeya fangzhongdai]
MVKEQCDRLTACCREVAYTTLSSFRVNDFFLVFSASHRAGLSPLPCQWRRIIGSSSGLTSDKCKKIINWMVFRQNGQEYINMPLFSGIKRQN